MEHSHHQLSSAPSLPSREELLCIVREHSQSLGQAGEGDRVGASAGGGLDVRVWRELMDFFFIRGVAAAQSSHDDDLVFFVRVMGFCYRDGAAAGEGEEESKPYFVRRWAPELGKVVGNNISDVDWRRTFYLNLIAHTSYSLTVAICSTESLENYRRSTGSPLTPTYKVTKRVYASPSRVDFQRENSKGAENVVAYPDICFEVDNGDDTFDSVILKHEGDCFCVLLHAYGGASIPGVADESAEEKKIADGPLFSDRQGSDSSRVTLFSGFVNYDLVCSAFGTGKGDLGGLLHFGDNGDRSERIVMRGPGGRGRVDVIASCVSSSTHGEGEVASGVSLPKGTKRGIESIFHKAVVVAKNAYIAASSIGRSPDGLLALRCCLLSVSLPWDSLAHDLLFKRA